MRVSFFFLSSSLFLIGPFSWILRESVLARSLTMNLASVSLMLDFVNRASSSRCSRVTRSRFRLQFEITVYFFFSENVAV